MPDALTRLSTRLKDAGRYSSLSEAALGLADMLHASLTAGNSPAKANRLASALRRLESGPLPSGIRARLRRLAAEAPDVIHAAHEAQWRRRTRPPALTRTTILKAPGSGGERGVLVCQFEYNWSRLSIGVGDLHALLEEYDVIWGTSWSPTDYLVLSHLLAATTQPLYVLPANLAEVQSLRALSSRVCVPEQLASEFQDPTSFRPRPFTDRDIDLLVVSNWAPFKRHWELFAALHRLSASLRVVCVGQPEGPHTRSEIERLARIYRVPQSIEFFESLPWETVRELQGRSRAAAIFSRREGQCMAAVEALFSGASIGLREGARIGAAAYINPETGHVLRPGMIASDLQELIAGAGLRRPREWAVEHLGYSAATKRLNSWLVERAHERGLPWTRDIAEHWWAPYPWVGHIADRERLTPAALDLHCRFPQTFPVDLLESSRH